VSPATPKTRLPEFSPEILNAAEDWTGLAATPIVGPVNCSLMTLFSRSWLGRPLAHLLSLSAAVAIGLAPALAQERAPLPAKLLAAQTVYLSNESDLKAFDRFYSELRKWGRFKVVPSKDEADLIAVLRPPSRMARLSEPQQACPAEA
jgi:hypothetical protein